MKKYLSEAVGTMLLMMIGTIGYVAVNTMLVYLNITVPIGFSLLTCSLLFGLALTVAYDCFGPISGAHLNPAVTFGMFMANRMTGKDALLYVVAQIVGAFAGVELAAVVLDTHTTLGASGYGDLSPFNTQLVQAIVVDVVMSFAFVLLYLMVTRQKDNQPVAGLVLGLGFAVMYGVELPLINGAANPAKSLATAVLQSQGSPLSQVWAFLLAPLLGAALAALLYLYLAFDKAPRQESGQEEEASEAAAVADADDDVLELDFDEED